MSQDKEIKHLEEVLKLMSQYKVTNVEMGDLKITKNYHEFPEQDNKNAKSYESMTDDQLLFMSAE